MNTALRCKASAAAGNVLASRSSTLTQNERRRGHRPGATIKYLRCTTSGAAGNGLGTTIKHLRAAAGIGLGTTIKDLRDAAGIGLGATIKYLRRSSSGDAVNGLRRNKDV
jgi:hypothetical protein